jgi:hypothetical protein
MGSDSESRGAIAELRRLIPEIWIAGVDEKFETEGLVFDELVTSHRDAYLGTYERFDLASLPIGPELYKLVAPFEGQALDMLGRIRFHRPSDYPRAIRGVPQYVDSYEARVDLFGRHCRFWNYVLDHFDIDAVISQNFGHQGFDFVALQLAKAKGIPTLIFNETAQFPMVQFVQEDANGLGRLELGMALKQRLSGQLLPEADNFVRRSLGWITSSPDRTYNMKAVNKYQTSPIMSWLVDSRVQVNPEFSITQIRRSAATKMRRLVSDPLNAIRTFRRSQKWVRATKQSMAEEAHYSTKATISNPYIYFPLHFQPEATTSAKGRNFFRLREAVCFLASALPDGWQLIVKEHPHQWRRLLPRPEGFFAQIAAIPNVQLVHHSSDNQHLVSQARAVACVSHSSITAHAVMRGTPVISLGNSHFRTAPGYFCIETSEELRSVMHKIASNLPTRSDEDVQAFISALEASTFEGLLGYKPLNISETEYQRVLSLTESNIPRIIREWLVLRGLYR